MLLSIQIVSRRDDLVRPAFSVARSFSPRSGAQQRGLKLRAAQGTRPTFGCGHVPR